MTEIVTFVDEGLGHSSYLVDLGDGRALVVDPPRIPNRHVDEAHARGLEIALTADTHSHADYVSGSPELAAQGALFLASKGANLEIAHRAVAAGDEIELRPGLVLRAIATPGHTPDHLAYLLYEGDRPAALFSGGSLMVGTVGRTDLLGPEPREELARQLYRALRDQILTLPDDVTVYPTHGAGSFCSAPGASERTTTIGRERATNPMLAVRDEDTFVERLLAGFGSFPSYFSRLPELNRRGPRLYRSLPALDRLDVSRVRELIATGAVLVDVRTIEDFAAGHIPGALNVDSAGFYDPKTNRLKPKAELAAIANTLPAGPAVSYCNTGHWAATDWFVLHDVLGRKETRLYAGSMVEWTSNANRPIESSRTKWDDLKKALGLGS